MADKRAQKIISQYDTEYGSSESSNFRSLWQDTADLQYPTNNQIVDKTTPGQQKTARIYDFTAIFESQNTASGLAQNLMPPGQKFFAIKASNRDKQDIDAVKRYLNKATEITHDALFGSTFPLELVETLRSLITFGTCNLHSNYTTELIFKNFPISSYEIQENEAGRVNTIKIKFERTAVQATEMFDDPGKSVTVAMAKPETQTDKFWFIQAIQPRTTRNPNFKDNLNMPFESVVVSVKDVVIVDEGGFEEFPNSVARWLKASNEKFGRGIGTEVNPQVRQVNNMKHDFNMVGNNWAKPAKEVLDTFDGEVDCSPDALNFVTEMGSIRAIQGDARGNFPITKDILEMERQVIRDAYFSQAFAPLTGLTGDRRNTLEIRQRVQEAFKKIGAPIGRIQSELFTPTITRVILLLLRNGVIPPPPPELENEGFKLEYVGPLSLALQSSEIEASQIWMGVIKEIAEVEPTSVDNIDFDDTIRRIGRNLGVNEEDIASIEERDAKRETRAQQLQEQKEMELATLAAQNAGQLGQTPEQGSPAEALIGQR
ncbi:MAG: portal protein [Dehalococcoidia bacterium]